MATTYVPTSGIHVEELPTATSAADSDGLIINVNNDTLSQITVSNLMSGVQDQIDTLSADLKDKVKVTQHIAMADFGLTAPITTADLVVAMINSSETHPEYMSSVSTNSFTDLPVSGGYLDVQLASMTSTSSTWRGKIVYYPNSNDRTRSLWIGRPNSDYSEVDWYQVGLTAYSATSLNALESDDVDA